MSRERAVAFVVARLDSQRLQAKQLREIGGRAILDWVLDRVAGARELDGIVVTTVHEPVNDRLWELARRRGVECYAWAGDVNDVTSRLRCAAEASGAEICVLVSADCPLVSSEGIDLLVRELREHPDADTCSAERDDACSNLLAGTSAARLRGWQLADDLSARPELREHQFPIIRQEEHLFDARVFPLDARFRGPLGLRLSVDTWADLEFMNELHDRLRAEGRPFELQPAVELLGRAPELRRINAHVHQREVGEPRVSALLVADAGEPWGYGHAMRCRELGLQIVERTGHPVAFLVDDAEAVRLLGARGLRTHWGALGRTARRPPPGTTMEPAPDLAARHDIVVLDLFAGRELEPGWRAAFDGRVVVLDRADGWALEADAVVLPGVTGPPEWNLGRTPRPVGKRDTPVVGGREHLILRREVRRAAAGAAPASDREVDVLAYLRDAAAHDGLRRFCEAEGLRLRALDPTAGMDDGFPARLASARTFVSGFGVAFQEALATGTFPIAWPADEAHARDARRFYDAFGLEPAIVREVADLDAIRTRAGEALPAVEDGTPNVVEAVLGRAPVPR